MFYTYALPFDTGGSAVYSKAVGAATVQSPVAVARTAPDLIVVGAQTAQSPGSRSGGSTANPFSSDFSYDFGEVIPNSPFSREFSSEYGSGVGIGRGITLTVYKLLGISGAMSPLLITQAELPTGTPLGASHGQASSISWTYFASWLISLTSSMAASLSFPRINYAVVAARSAGVARLRRSYAFWLRVNTPSNLFTDEFTDEWGVGRGGHVERLSLSINQVLTRTISGPLVGAQTTAIVKRVSRFSRALSASVALTLRGPAQLARATSTAVQSRILTAVRLLAAASGNAARIIRRAPMRSNTTSAQSPRMSFGGNLYARTLSALSGQSLGLLRQLAVLRSTVTGTPGTLIRSILKPLAVVSGSGALVVKTVSLVRPAVTLGLTLATRSVGIPRQVISGSLVAMARIAAHVSPVIQAVSTSVASLATALTHGQDFVLHAAQTMATHLATVSARLRSFNATQTQSGSVVRGIGSSLAATLAAVASIAKTVAWSASIASQSVAFLALSSAHFALAKAVTGVSLAALRASRVIFSAAQPQGSHVSFGSEKFAHVFPGTTFGNVASVLRVTGKLVDAVTGLIVEHIRGVVALTLHTELVQVSYGQASRSVYLVAAQTQRSRTVRWFHLFVPQWAYQQTTLLPPGGGPAEPPAFGPIDPADQTTFAFDWAVRGNANDPIASATITAVPPDMTFFGPVFVSGSLVEVTVLPFTPSSRLPMIYRLRCTAVFASGRRSSFTIPVPVRTL